MIYYLNICWRIEKLPVPGGIEIRQRDWIQFTLTQWIRTHENASEMGFPGLPDRLKFACVWIAKTPKICCLYIRWFFIRSANIYSIKPSSQIPLAFAANFGVNIISMPKFGLGFRFSYFQNFILSFRPADNAKSLYSADFISAVIPFIW